MRHEALTEILHELRADLENRLSDQTVRLYLYGSQARNEARSDSDIDVLVILNGEFQYFDLVQKTGDIAARLSLQYDTVISLAFVSAQKFANQTNPFLMNIRQEGIAV